MRSDRKYLLAMALEYEGRAADHKSKAPHETENIARLEKLAADYRNAAGKE